MRGRLRGGDFAFLFSSSVPFFVGGRGDRKERCVYRLGN
jgi:hypothetical protein